MLRPYIDGALAEPRLSSDPQEIAIAGSVDPQTEKPVLPTHKDIEALATSNPDRYNAIQRDLARLIRQITGPGDIDENYYRASARGDRLLLGRYRIMHLHLLGRGSDVLVYLMQFPDLVLLLELGTHQHLEDAPPGKRFNLTLAKRVITQRHPRKLLIESDDDE